MSILGRPLGSCFPVGRIEINNNNNKKQAGYALFFCTLFLDLFLGSGQFFPGGG